MTIPTQAVQIRRIYYASGTPSVIQPVLYDDPYDAYPNLDVLDAVLSYDGQIQVDGYTWNGTNQIEEASDPIGDALRADAKAYWKFDDDGLLADATGRGNTWTNNGSVISASGKIDQAIAPNGTEQYLSQGSTADLTVGNGSFTIAGWIYITAFLNPELGEGALFWKADDTADEIYFSVQNDTKVFLFYTNDGNNYTSVFVPSSGQLSAGQWYFVQAWRNLNNTTINIKLNNSDSQNTNTVGTNPTTSATIAIGAYAGGTHTNRFNGRVDEFGFWHRILTTEESDYLFNGGVGRTLYP